MLAEGSATNTLMQLRKGLGILGSARRGYKALLPSLISNPTNSIVEKNYFGFGNDYINNQSDVHWEKCVKSDQKH